MKIVSYENVNAKIVSFEVYDMTLCFEIALHTIMDFVQFLH